MSKVGAKDLWIAPRRATHDFPPMPVIDAHVHLYPPELNRDPAAWAARAGEAHWARLCTRTRRDGRPVQGFPSVDGLLREMDAAGVARAVLLGWYWEKPESCEAQNRFYAGCVRAHPDRLSAFATLHPAAGRAAVLAEIRRAHHDGLAGLGELSPHSQGHGTGDAVFLEALALAAELRMPVNFHVTDPAGKTYPGRIETPLADFVRLARDFPRLNFILAHWGGLLPLADPAAASLPNLFYDTAASPLLYDPGVFRRMLDAAGAGRVLWGSDYPLVLFPREETRAELGRFLRQAAEAGLTPAERDALLGGNAARLLTPASGCFQPARFPPRQRRRENLRGWRRFYRARAGPERRAAPPFRAAATGRAHIRRRRAGCR
jgi:predicted TIM-barrel fold metal-dependent hydrolase